MHPYRAETGYPMAADTVSIAMTTFNGHRCLQ
jgi:hypothetical protein